MVASRNGHFNKNGQHKMTDNFSSIVIRIKRFFTTTRLSRVAFIFLIIFIAFHYFTHHLFKLPSGTLQPEPNLPYSSYRLRDLKHINELNRIKRSVSNELRDLEGKRNQIQDDISLHQNSLTKIEQTVKKAQTELETLKRQIIQLKNEQKEAEKPKMAAPARLLATETDNVHINPPKHYYKCQMQDCFDYSRCSLTSQFPVYVYPHKAQTDETPFSTTSFVLDVTRTAFQSIPYMTSDPAVACLYVVVLGEVESTSGANSQPIVDKSTMSDWLHSLPHWRGDGRNHLLVYLSRQSTAQNPLLGVDVGRAMIAQTNFATGQFRFGFDIVMPTLTLVGTGQQNAASEEDGDKSNMEEWLMNDGGLWSDDDIPLQVPAMRDFLLSFQGQWGIAGEIPLSQYNPEGKVNVEKQPSASPFYEIFIESLTLMKDNKLHGKFHLETKCPEDRIATPGYSSEWALCGSFSSRASILSRSTFTLIPSSDKLDLLISTSLLTARIGEALRSGAIPVIIGRKEMLPFSEYIEWEKAALFIPQARITELSFLLINFPHADILALRRQGRFLYDTYFSSARYLLEGMLSVVRTRLQIPPVAVEDTTSDVVPHKSFKIDEHDPAPGDAASEFGMPPLEPPTASLRFVRNFTGVTMDARNNWNNIPGPFSLFPSVPEDRILPTDAQFIGSTDGFRPIGAGEGGTGRIFQESLGGNCRKEQFTIVLLTYERDEVLLQAVERLHDLPYLNKVIVVWNSPSPPQDHLRWPDIGVEVVVITPEKNSLNNRFMPWDQIETDAVLSLDDDAHLRHDEILFGFRVWRQSRNRVVGFPGRFHAWDIRNGGWAYNSNYTCELSMVLTGAAFIHKYYMYLYTYWMPSPIRDTVDEFMNCEDIAMNFLVSHMTRQPPVKVTSRWTFRCPGCPMALSQSQEHFEERHKCINRFVKVFGYMPLVFTQFRVDSILFKTRLPHDKQKCFKFI
ncbi:exostosin-like 3 [Clavelina lepadiformis]|uniref:Exostosin-3 n=1 Tax=Clavelina lepadiformis TaxID=159417 RepID=A0ABP0FY39_CLALP